MNEDLIKEMVLYNVSHADEVELIFRKGKNNIEVSLHVDDKGLINDIANIVYNNDIEELK